MDASNVNVDTIRVSFPETDHDSEDVLAVNNTSGPAIDIVFDREEISKLPNKNDWVIVSWDGEVRIDSNIQDLESWERGGTKKFGIRVEPDQ